jgi:hypothetical protein
MARAADDSPWQVRDMARAAWLSALGLLGLGSCWYGIGGEANFHHQVKWLVGAVAALLVAAAGMSGWLLAGLRAVHEEMHSVMSEVRTERLHEVLDIPDEFAEVSTSGVDMGQPGYVTSASMTRVHRSGCPHVHGKAVEPISDQDIQRLGLAYCGVCCQ